MLSVDFIVPCFNEADNIRAFYTQFANTFEKSDYLWRLIMIDDGSTDKSFDLIKELSVSDDRITGIQFSRNFGKEAAIYAGLKESSADYVGIIDADLQQPPSIALAMLKLLCSDNDIDCVAAFQENRRESQIVSFLKARFYRIFAKASHTNTLQDASDFRVFKRSVTEAILELNEYHRFSKGIFAWVGFNTIGYPYTPDERTAGNSKWTIKKLFKYAFEGLLSFTTSPLHAITILGFSVSIIALIYAVVLIIRTLIVGIETPGYASTLAFVLLFGGGQFLAIGVLGEYIARMYIQGKNRPVYIIRQVSNKDPLHSTSNSGVNAYSLQELNKPQ